MPAHTSLRLWAPAGGMEKPWRTRQRGAAACQFTFESRLVVWASRLRFTRTLEVDPGAVELAGEWYFELKAETEK